MYSLGNRLWHTDASFQDPPGRYSMLSARVVPPVAADTEFADMRAGLRHAARRDEGAARGPPRAPLDRLFAADPRLRVLRGGSREAEGRDPSRWCARCRARAAGRSTWRRTPRASSIGRCRRGGSCCSSSSSTRRSPSSCTATCGARRLRDLGQPGHDAPRRARSTTPSIAASCAASRRSTSRRPSPRPPRADGTRSAGGAVCAGPRRRRCRPSYGAESRPATEKRPSPLGVRITISAVLGLMPASAWIVEPCVTMIRFGAAR